MTSVGSSATQTTWRGTRRQRSASRSELSLIFNSFNIKYIHSLYLLCQKLLFLGVPPAWRGELLYRVSSAELVDYILSNYLVFSFQENILRWCLGRGLYTGGASIASCTCLKLPMLIFNCGYPPYSVLYCLRAIQSVMIDIKAPMKEKFIIN